MNWININVTVIDSEEFLGATPTERATWLCLIRYCVGQENGGRIEGAKDWKDRKWQQVVRVTSREVSAKCDLWSWEGDDIAVAFYPLEKEAEIQHLREIGRISSDAKRDAAKANGAKGGRPRKTPNESEQKTQREETQREETQTNPTETHRKEVEVEVEVERKEKPSFAPDGASSDPPPPKSKEIAWNPIDGFIGITEADTAAWAEAFPALEIKSQIARAHQWLLANPTKRKKAVRRFLVAWLTRSQERGGDRGQSASPQTKPNHHLGFRTSSRVDSANLPVIPEDEFNAQKDIPF